MKDGNELSIIKDILDGNIKKLNLDKNAFNDMHNFLITHKKEVIKVILSSEKKSTLNNKLDPGDTVGFLFIQSMLLTLSSIITANSILNKFPLFTNLYLTMMGTLIISFISEIIISFRVLDNIYKKKMSKNYAKVKYNNLVKYFSNVLDKPLKENHQSEVLTDNFLQEIYSTIKDIRNNSYETAKDELLSLQTLATEYISYQKSNNNLELTLNDQDTEFRKNLESIKEKVSQKQQAYKIQNVLRIIDKLIAGEKVVVEQNATVNVILHNSNFKETEESLNNIDCYLDNIDDYIEYKYAKRISPQITENMEIIAKNYEEIKKHKLKYALQEYVYKYQKENWISGILFAILNPIIAITSGNFILTSLLNSFIFYLIPSVIIGKHYLNKKLKKIRNYFAEYKGYREEQEAFKSVLKTGYERSKEEKLEEIKNNFKNKKVDSFIKDLYYDIELIKANPYEDCEKDIIELNSIANDYALYMYQRSDSSTLKINQGIYDFYKRQYEVENRMNKKQTQVTEIVEINKALKEALDKPKTDNYLINNDIFIQDVIKVINTIKANDYPYSNNELQEVRGILVNYLNWKYGTNHTYEEITSQMKEFYYQLNNVIFKVKNKQTISDNIEDINEVMSFTLKEGIKLDTNLGLDVNKLELKLK